MWRGAKVAYVFIAMCVFPVAIGGYWAYGNLVSLLLVYCSLPFYNTMALKPQVPSHITFPHSGYALKSAVSDYCRCHLEEC